MDDEGTSEDVVNTRMKEESFSHALPTDRDANNPDISWSTSALLWRADGATDFGARGGIGGVQAHEKLEDAIIGSDVVACCPVVGGVLLSVITSSHLVVDDLPLRKFKCAVEGRRLFLCSWSFQQRTGILSRGCVHTSPPADLLTIVLDLDLITSHLSFYVWSNG
jgi:hypothetical protein